MDFLFDEINPPSKPQTYLVQCINCKLITHLDASELDFECVSTSEREQGCELFYEASSEVDCECGRPMEVTFECSEYPEGSWTEINKEATGCILVTTPILSHPPSRIEDSLDEGFGPEGDV